MENKKISIITAVYNSEDYIDDTIASVLNQTYKNWEWLIIDDCSTDNTAIKIKEYKDTRIKYIKLEENQGAAQARNRGLELAKSNIIAFIDADDTWMEEKLERQYQFMMKNSYGFTFTSYKIMGKEKPITIPSKLDYSAYMKNTIIGMLTVMINRDIIGDFRIVNIRKDHDSMTWAKILRSGHNAHGLNECLSEYRKVEGSISNNKFEAIKNHWKNCREIEGLNFLKQVIILFSI